MAQMSLIAALAALLSLAACGDGGRPGREGSVVSDRGGARLPTGAACASASDCESFCLTSVISFGQTMALPGGYCTRKCQLSTECGGTDVCMTFLDAVGSEVARYCLAGCPPAACRSGYVCTSGSVCFPR